MAAATLYVQLVTPRYTADAKILLESRDTFYTRPPQERVELAPLIDEQAVASQVQGSARSILATQRSSTRYFQRPDAENLSLDPSATAAAAHARPGRG